MSLEAGIPEVNIIPAPGFPSNAEQELHQGALHLAFVFHFFDGVKRRIPQ
ncbi:MAG: hypothetical protein JJE04_00470 [Acidobacteriia bacterium]|nr:hypothetical protein [Terriglobia bacterium]